MDAKTLFYLFSFAIWLLERAVSYNVSLSFDSESN